MLDGGSNYTQRHTYIFTCQQANVDVKFVKLDHAVF